MNSVVEKAPRHYLARRNYKIWLAKFKTSLALHHIDLIDHIDLINDLVGQIQNISRSTISQIMCPIKICDS